MEERVKLNLRRRSLQVKHRNHPRNLLAMMMMRTTTMMMLIIERNRSLPLVKEVARSVCRWFRGDHHRRIAWLHPKPLPRCGILLKGLQRLVNQPIRMSIGELRLDDGGISILVSIIIVSTQVLRSSAFEGMLLKATWPGNEPVPQEILVEIIKHSIPAFKYSQSVFFYHNISLSSQS